MHKSFSTLACLGATLLLLVGCSGNPNLAKMESPQSAMVFGSVVAEPGINNISMLEWGKVYVAPFHAPPSPHVYTNGLFVFENLPAGEYWVQSMHAGRDRLYTFVSTSDIGQTDKFKKEHVFTVKPGELYYLGSFRIKTDKESGMFTSGSFHLERVKEPDEKAVLTGLLQFAKGSGWDARMQRRIDRLK